MVLGEGLGGGAGEGAQALLTEDQEILVLLAQDGALLEVLEQAHGRLDGEPGHLRKVAALDAGDDRIGLLGTIMRIKVSARRPRAGLKAMSRALFSPRRTSRASSRISANDALGYFATKFANVVLSIIETTLGSRASPVPV